MSAPGSNSFAFPTPEFYDEKLIGSYPGMTLRDYFAAAAMQGFVAQKDLFRNTDSEQIAHIAYELADAMLAERAK